MEKEVLEEADRGKAEREHEKEMRLAEYLEVAEEVVATTKSIEERPADAEATEGREGVETVEVSEERVAETAAVFPELPFGDKPEGEAKQESGWRKKRRKRKHRH